MPTLVDARRDLDAIRSLMERAKDYRYLPPCVPLLAGGLALASSLGTHLLGEQPFQTALLPFVAMWGAAFAVSLGTQILFSIRAARREGTRPWSSLTVEIIHCLWPSFLSGILLSIGVVNAGAAHLIPALWMICYGTAGVVAGAYARPAVRGLGLAFLGAGAINLFYPFPPAIALGTTFGVFHLIYGVLLAVRPYNR